MIKSRADHTDANASGHPRRDVFGGDVNEVRQFHRQGVADVNGPLERHGRFGKFIVLEGMVPSESTAVARVLAEMLCQRGIEVILSREPGGSPGADAIRRLLVGRAARDWGPATELLLHAAQRLDHLQQTVVPALQEGVWVICDGYIGYSIARLGFGHRLGRDAVLRLHQQTTGGLMPDLTILLQPATENFGTQRRDSDLGFSERVAEGYRSLIEDPEISAKPMPALPERRETARQIIELLELQLHPGEAAVPPATNR